MDNPCVAADWGGAKCKFCLGEDHGLVAQIPGDAGVEGDCPDCKGTDKQPYDLDGFLWTPDATNTGVYIQRGKLGKAKGGILVKNHAVITNTHKDGWHLELTNGYVHVDDCLPLLPSPAEINAQSNPRAVAIASLERAGFEDDTLRWRNESGTTRWSITLWPDNGNLELSMNSCDPVLALYAVDCFKVLKPWIDAVDWGK